MSVYRQYIQTEKNKAHGIGQFFSIPKLKKFKASDTLFVMGSGPSICDYSDTQFEHIEMHDSFGFTNWTMHDLVPTFYMNEFKSHTKELEACQEQEVYNLVQRQKDYANTALIFRAGSTDFSTISAIEKYGFPFSNVFLTIDVGVLGKDKKTFAKSFFFMKKIGLLKNNYIVFQKTASLFRIIVMAFKLGYKNIVLCGIDLTGDEYFFEREREKYNKKNLMFPILTTYRNEKHKTNDPRHSTGNMIISDLIEMINELLLIPNGVSLYVGAPQGFFHPSLPLYEY